MLPFPVLRSFQPSSVPARFLKGASPLFSHFCPLRFALHPSLALIFFLLILFRTLSCLSKRYLALFQSLPNSLRKTPGVGMSGCFEKRTPSTLRPTPVPLNSFRKSNRFMRFRTVSVTTGVGIVGHALSLLHCLFASLLPPFCYTSSPAQPTPSGKRTHDC